MRFAVCISGHVRLFEECFPSLAKNVLDGRDCDVFVHTWRSREYRTEEWTRGLARVTVTEEELRASITNLVELRVEEDDSVRRNPAWAMFRKVFLCDQLRSSWAEREGVVHDLVVRARPDIVWQTRLDLESMVGNDVVNVPGRGGFGGINDMIAVAPPAVMTRVYASLFEVAPLVFHPETRLRDHIASSGTAVVQFNLDFIILRPNGNKFSF